jgi:hypothetical protein
MGFKSPEHVTVDTRPLPKLIFSLLGAHVGRPAVVIGGGPSAPRQWDKAAANLDNPVLISANGHAFKLGTGADYIFCKDHRSTETKELMEPALREFDVPIVSRYYWADFRVVRWPVTGNSGMMAIGLAAMMGCCPIVPIGFDAYQNGTYFHNLTVTNVSLGRPEGHWRSRYQRLRDTLSGANVRAIDGPLEWVFPRFNPLEQYPRYEPVPVFERFRGMGSYAVRFLRSVLDPYDRRAEIPAGAIMAVTIDEQRSFLRTGCVELLSADGPRPGNA